VLTIDTTPGKGGQAYNQEASRMEQHKKTQHIILIGACYLDTILS
jgi:hypothetical protein